MQSFKLDELSAENYISNKLIYISIFNSNKHANNMGKRRGIRYSEIHFVGSKK